ncbi:hypothetical protein CF65_00587 [Aggregatibacter actinomycetemcomitans HK1651]|nr:hypothetical protein CF65_00587 [Aggregatibacter actinomycetemcomitans HK1651]
MLWIFTALFSSLSPVFAFFEFLFFLAKNLFFYIK